MNDINPMVVLSDAEIDSVSGGLAPLVAWGLWTAGGAAVGLAGAAIVHFWGKNHKHT